MGKKSKRTGAPRTTSPSHGKKGEPNGFSLISDDKLIALYAGLLKCRIVEQRLARRSSGSSTNGTRSLLCGFEAGTVGVAIDLLSEDSVCSPNHGIVTGFHEEPLIQAVLLSSGKKRAPRPSPSRSKSGWASRNGASPDAPDPTHTQTAIGAALVNKTSKNGKVAVIFGDESASAAWGEALHIAAVHALPMIFVSRNGNRRNQTAGKLHTKTKQIANGETPWFPSIAVDCNDVVAVYRVANEAISRARLGRGPTLIECRPFVLSGKTNGALVSSGKHKHLHDPISNMEKYLHGKGLLRPTLRSEIVAEFKRQLNRGLNAF